DAGRDAAGRAGADERVGGTIVGDAVAGLVDVADARGGPAHGGALGVGGAVVTNAVADLVGVADPRCRSAHGRALGVGGAVDVGPVAVLLEVADAGREAARRAGSGDRVGRAVVRDAVAAVIDVA